MDADDLITATIFAVIVAVALRGFAWHRLKAIGARSWPTSQGKIESGTVIEYHARYFTYYIAQMAYSCIVNGEYFSGCHEKVFFKERPTSS